MHQLLTFVKLSIFIVNHFLTVTLQVAFSPLESLTVIFAVPGAIAFTLPSDVTVATDLLLDVQEEILSPVFVALRL